MHVGSFRTPRNALAICAFALAALVIGACSDSATGTGPPPPLPDDRLIVFVSDSGNTSYGNSGSIFVMHADGTHMTRVTPPGRQDETPAWSPDGSTILFESDRVPRGIWAVNVDGSNLRSLVAAEEVGFAGEPAWSPNGHAFAFSASLSDSFHNTIDIIEIADADGTHPHRVMTNETDVASPSWSPDGTSILFGAGEVYPHIYVVGTDGTHERQLSNELDFEPEWSPDGSHIAVATLDTNNFNILAKITVMAADGSNRRTLTTEGVSRQPSWSPDGRQIAYEAFSRDSTAGVRTTPLQIFRMNADGSNKRALTSNAFTSWSPAWKPTP